MPEATWRYGEKRDAKRLAGFLTYAYGEDTKVEGAREIEWLAADPSCDAHRWALVEVEGKLSVGMLTPQRVRIGEAVLRAGARPECGHRSRPPSPGLRQHGHARAAEDAGAGGV